MKNRRRHKRKALTAQQKKEIKNLFRTIGQLGSERGENAEDLVEETLAFLQKHGLLKFERKKPNNPKVDFEIWGQNPYICNFTLDVKSSQMRVNALGQHGLPNHHLFVVKVGEYHYGVALRILTIFFDESKLVPNSEPHW